MNAIHPMQEIKEKLKQILKVIPPKTEICYIDYPVHNNVGDLLIMKGTEAFFRDNQYKVKARLSCINFKKGMYIPKEWTIVLHGGGNLGDMYLQHQSLREYIIDNYPEHRIVILPQTIYFKSENEFNKTAVIFNRHKDLHVFVRDANNYEMAKKKFHKCFVYLCPDMAHHLWPMKPTGKAEKEELHFLRTDIEINHSYQKDVSSTHDQKDWSTLLTPLDRKITRMFMKLHKMDRAVGNILPVQPFWYKYADYLVSKSVKFFSTYHKVRTSRLHGHILACLLDKENILLDNSYGKNSNYYLTWTYKYPSAKLDGEINMQQQESVAP
ncbi:polysaccharide pyruvyl transferase family protein [Paenibacillus naphthalenovorans]|uniref:polysaccharide pyruvyl transferase family protein n=1 Tax=Paenibacillus naphthalenovorans TaxID=162209 RepID=UPI003D291161